MQLKLKGKKYKYLPIYRKKEDPFNMELPSYHIVKRGQIFLKNEWKPCSFYLSHFKGRFSLEITPVNTIDKNGYCDIGKVDKHLRIDKIYLNYFQILKIKLYDSFLISKTYLLKFLDCIKRIGKKSYYFLIPLIGSISYYLSNFIWENKLRDFINENILIQSFIIFLSILSIINIFQPITVRKQWSIEEINELIEKRIAEHEENLKNEKRKNKIINKG